MSATIMDAAEQVKKGNFGMTPGGENDRRLGAISDRDITIRAIAGGRVSNTSMREVMSEPVAWAFEEVP